MRTIIFFFLDILRLVFVVQRKDGFKKIVSENILLRQQLQICSRKLKKCPPLKVSDRVIFSLFSIFIEPKKMHRVAIMLTKETMLKFHKALIKRKYSIIFRNKNKRPGRKRTSKDLVKLVVETKEKNPTYGCPKIVSLIFNVFEIKISVETVRKILIKHYRPLPGNGPSWLGKMGNSKDKLWSLDFFRVESILLQSLWIMVVMDQFSRRIVGFEVCADNLSGSKICSMFEKISSDIYPKYLSTDNDPLFRSHRWKNDLEWYDVDEVKSVPFIPFSHPYIERLIGTIRRDFTDRTLFWSKKDAENKLELYQDYYNSFRVHDSHSGKTPNEVIDQKVMEVAILKSYRWKEKCGGLFHTPVAA